MSKSIISVIALVLLSQRSDAKLPDFIQTCIRSQANVTECVEANANVVLPKLVKGIKDINLPPLVEIKLPTITNRPFSTYNLYFDGILESLDGIQYTDSFFDSENWFAYGKLRFPKLKVRGKYKLDGIIGTEVVKGNGTADVALDNIAFEVIWLFSTIKKNSSEYLELKESTLISYELSQVEYNFENLFSGNKTKGVEINNYLNRNWSILEDDFSRQVADVVHKVSFEVGNLLLKTVSLDELFPK